MFAGLKIIDSHAHFPVSDVSIRASMGLPEESRRVPRPRPERPFHGHAVGNGLKLGAFPMKKVMPQMKSWLSAGLKN